MTQPRLLSRSWRLLALTLIAAGLGASVEAALWLPRSLSDHMLFQQGAPIVVWGRATPGSAISVVLATESGNEIASDSFRPSELVMERVAGKKTSRSAPAKGKQETADPAARWNLTGVASAGADGRWRIELDPLKASNLRYQLTVVGDGGERTIRDILVGELWLSGGEANMALQVEHDLGGPELMVEPRRSTLRFFLQDAVSENWKEGVPPEPQEDTPNGRWVVPDTMERIGACSAVSFVFAKKLHSHMNRGGRQVPVGVLHTATGPSAIGGWLSREAAQALPQLKDALSKTWNEGPWTRFRQPWQQVTALYNLKIAPLAPHAVRGFLWYHGESEAGEGEAGAERYRAALSCLIEDWRQRFVSPAGQPQAFLLAQLHAYDEDGRMAPEQLESWAFFREAQLDVAQALPGVAALPTHDINPVWKSREVADPHPSRPLHKSPIGERMAVAARALAYGESVLWNGPLFERMEVVGNTARLHFRRTDGLRPRGGEWELNGFTLCGEDRRFQPAEARIVDLTVELTAAGVERPVAAAYGFTSMNREANLVNHGGLPAYPFRTDRVPSAHVRVGREARTHATRVTFMPGLVAFWNFAETGSDGLWGSSYDPRVNDRSYPVYLRRIGDTKAWRADEWRPGSPEERLVRNAGGPFGGSVRFNRGHVFGEVPRAAFDGTPLDIGGRQPFTMVAWLRFTGQRHLICGVWDEGGWDKYGGRRQYALFGGLFGSRSVIAHLSATGAASYPQSEAKGAQYARLRAVEGGAFEDGQWVCAAMTFDPARREVTAWRDGKALPCEQADPVIQDVFQHKRREPVNPAPFAWPIFSPRGFVLKFNGYSLAEGGVAEHWLEIEAGPPARVRYNRSEARAGVRPARHRVRFEVARDGKSLLIEPAVFDATPGAEAALPDTLALRAGDRLLTSLERASADGSSWTRVGKEIAYAMREGAPFTFGRALGLGSEERNHGSELELAGVAVFNRVLTASELRKLTFAEEEP